MKGKQKLMNKEKELTELLEKLTKAYEEIGMFPETQELKALYYDVSDIIEEYEMLKKRG